MACDVPVAATRSGGFINVTAHEENGLLFNDGDISGIADAVTTLVENGVVRARCISNGRITAFEKFSIERTIHNYEELFRRIIPATG